MSTLDNLTSMRAKILTLAESHGASKLRVFGSVAREEDTVNSDIDFLVSLSKKADLLYPIYLELHVLEG